MRPEMVVTRVELLQLFDLQPELVVLRRSLELQYVFFFQIHQPLPVHTVLTAD